MRTIFFLLILHIYVGLEAKSIDDIDYTYTTGEWIVSYCPKNKQIVEIPSHIDGFPVTKIDTGCFNICTMLRKVSLPNTIKSIGEYAFSGCKLLETIQLPFFIQFIGQDAFSRCSSLQHISVKNGKGLNFYDSKDGVLFDANFKTLIQYPIAKKDKTYKIPESVKTIKRNSFCFSQHLEHLIIPSAVTKIESFAIERLWNLKTFTVDKSNSHYSAINGVLYNKDQSVLISYPIHNAAKVFVVPPSVIQIAQDAFRCSQVKNVVFAGNTEILEHGVFAFCEKLENIDLSHTIETIGVECFYGCKSLTDIVLPNNLVKVGDGTFNKCNSLREVNVPKLVEFIGESVFSGCRNLEAITVDKSNPKYISDNGILIDNKNNFVVRCPEGLKLPSYKIPKEITEIGNKAFAGNKNIETIYLNEKLTNVGSYAFASCSNLKEVNGTFTASVIQENTFLDCVNLEKIFLGNNLKEISYGAFYNCQKLRTLTLPESLQSVGPKSFMNCLNLNQVKFGRSLNVIESSAFSNCRSLAAVDLPSSVERIGKNCFSGCFRLKSVQFNSRIKFVEFDTFTHCGQLETFTLPKSMEEYYNKIRFIDTHSPSLLLSSDQIAVDSNLSWSLQSDKSLILVGLPGQHIAIEKKYSPDGVWEFEKVLVLDTNGMRSIDISSHSPTIFYQFRVQN